LATLEGNRPHVRGILLYRADDEGIIIHPGKMKDLYKQLCDNSEAEFCFNDFQSNIQIRVSGQLELEDNQELKEEIVGQRDFLKPWVEQFGYEFLAIFRMTKGKACVWTMETNFAPKEYIEL